MWILCYMHHPEQPKGICKVAVSPWQCSITSRFKGTIYGFLAVVCFLDINNVVLETSLVVRRECIHLPRQSMWVQCLIGKLRSYMPWRNQARTSQPEKPVRRNEDPVQPKKKSLELTHGHKVDVGEKMEGPISSLNFTWTEGPRSGQLNFWFLNILPRQILLMKC